MLRAGFTAKVQRTQRSGQEMRFTNRVLLLMGDSDGKGGIGYQAGVWHRQTPAWGRRAACAPRSWTDFTIRVMGSGA